MATNTNKSKVISLSAKGKSALENEESEALQETSIGDLNFSSNNEETYKTTEHVEESHCGADGLNSLTNRHVHQPTSFAQRVDTEEEAELVRSAKETHSSVQQRDLDPQINNKTEDALDGSGMTQDVGSALSDVSSVSFALTEELSLNGQEQTPENNYIRTSNIGQIYLTPENITLLLDKIKALNVIISLDHKVKVLGTLLHFATWKKFQQQIYLAEVDGKSISKASLYIKVMKGIVLTEEEAKHAVVEFTFKDGDSLITFQCNKCFKQTYDLDGCTVIVCKNMPVSICKLLHEDYKCICDMLSVNTQGQIHRREFVIVATSSRGIMTANHGRLAEDNDFFHPSDDTLSPDELTQEFFMRTMNISRIKWLTLKEIITPGAQSSLVIKLWVPFKKI